MMRLTVVGYGPDRHELRCRATDGVIVVVDPFVSCHCAAEPGEEAMTLIGRCFDAGRLRHVAGAYLVEKWEEVSPVE